MYVDMYVDEYIYMHAHIYIQHVESVGFGVVLVWFWFVSVYMVSELTVLPWTTSEGAHPR